MFQRQRIIIIIYITINLISLYTLTEAIEDKKHSTCPKGYRGEKCDKKCPFSCGQNGCTRVLGKCLNCDETNDTCVNKILTDILTQSRSRQMKKRSKKSCAIGCKKCDSGTCLACKKNYYGDDCTMECSETCDGCNRKNGRCSACKPGWYNVRKCNRRCSEKCKIETGCEIRTGRCLNCREGWHGDWCERQCEIGFYGDNCQLLCPENCQRCVNISHCTLCRDNWIGLTCQGQRLNSKSPSGSNTVVAVVVTIVVIAILGAVAAAIVYIIRKRRLNRYETPIHQDETPLRYMPSIRRDELPQIEIEQDNDGYIRPNPRYINIRDKTKQTVDYRTENPDKTSCDPMESESLLPKVRTPDNGQGIDVPDEEAHYLRSNEPIYADIDETLMYEENGEIVNALPTEKEQDKVPDTASNTPPDTADKVISEIAPYTSDTVQDTTSDKIPDTAPDEVSDTLSDTSPDKEDKVTSDQVTSPSVTPSDTKSGKIPGATQATTSDKVPSAALDKEPDRTSKTLPDKVPDASDKIQHATSDKATHRSSDKVHTTESLHDKSSDKVHTTESLRDTSSDKVHTTDSLHDKSSDKVHTIESLRDTSSDKVLNKTSDTKPDKTTDNVKSTLLNKVSKTPGNVSNITPDKLPKTTSNKEQGAKSESGPDKIMVKKLKTTKTEVPDTKIVPDKTLSKEPGTNSGNKPDIKSDNKPDTKTIPDKTLNREPGTKSDNKPDIKSNNKPDTKTVPDTKTPDSKFDTTV